MESDSNILELIHSHLIESHLLQTARTLEKETGEKFATPELRLKHIVNTYQSLSELLSGLLPNVDNNIQNDAVATKTDEKATTKSDDTETASETKAITKKTNSKTKTAKAKNKTVKEEPKKPLSVDKEDEPEKTAEDKIKSKNTKSKETKQTTKKKTVTDEKDKTEKSKDTLPKKEPAKRKVKPPPIPHEWLFPEMESVLSQIFENLKNKDGTLTNKQFGTSSETKPKSEKMIKMTDKIDLDFEESDSNLPKEAVEQVLIRLSNGDVYESPSGRKRESGAKEKKVEDKEKAKHEEQMESKPFQKDILLIAEETSMVEEEDSNKSKSKKKKQKRNHDEVEEEPKEESEPKHSIKKKKSKVSIEEEKQSVEQTRAEEQVVENGVVEAGDETIKPKKKKKKKNKKKKNEDKDQDDTRTIDFRIDEKENDIEDSQNDFVTPRKKDLKTPMKKSTPFQRVKEDLIQIDEKLTDNSYEAKKGSTNGYGEKANDVLKKTKGKSFRQEKTKKKRGNYTGGTITTDVSSIYFSD
ncbi:nucleolar and coiled-body phosphoprotein 1-like [Clytia hemisphaerica]|uniref:Srp40 C-terminal domain-containing protein n=1 Tax=Clytia hemisphaerica TaxID=252671 RepID=A0A7M6DRA7_9CNID|eukprot:TCONS_00008631-protein